MPRSSAPKYSTEHHEVFTFGIPKYLCQPWSHIEYLGSSPGVTRLDFTRLKLSALGSYPVVRATRPITTGEEMFISYDESNDYDTRKSRWWPPGGLNAIVCSVLVLYSRERGEEIIGRSTTSFVKLLIHMLSCLCQSLIAPWRCSLLDQEHPRVVQFVRRVSHNRAR